MRQFMIEPSVDVAALFGTSVQQRHASKGTASPVRVTISVVPIDKDT